MSERHSQTQRVSAAQDRWLTQGKASGGQCHIATRGELLPPARPINRPALMPGRDLDFWRRKIRACPRPRSMSFS
jgi:hypothetical protein